MWVIATVIAAVVLILLYDYVYPRAYYDWRARRAGCGEIKKDLSWPLSIRTTAKFYKYQKNKRILQVAFSPEANPSGTRLLQVAGYNIIDTRDSENIKAMLSTQFSEFNLGHRHGLLSPLLGNGIFTVEGQLWKHQRTLLRPVFAREKVSQLQMIEGHFQAMLKEIGSGFVDMQAMFFNLTQDTAVHYLFGQHINSFGEDMVLVESKRGPITAEQLRSALSYVVFGMGVRKGAGPLWWLAMWPKFRKNLEICHDFANAVVEMVLNGKSSGDSFIKEAAEITQDREFLRDQAFTMFIAGRSTTASLLSHLILDISQDPEVWHTLREAVFTSIGNEPGDITFESLKKCSYLNHCLHESLRLHPNVPLNVRAASKDTTLPRGGGPDGSRPLFVPKGQMIQYNVYALHRAPEIWGSDAHKYRPERWTSHKLSPWTFLPFNGGPRICLGQQLALSEAGYVLARLAQEFSQIVPSEKILQKKYGFSYSITIKVDPGVEVRFVK